MEREREKERLGGKKKEKKRRRKKEKAVVMYGVVLYSVSGSVEGGGGMGEGLGLRSVGLQIIRPVVRDEGWPTCKQVTSVLDDNS